MTIIQPPNTQMYHNLKQLYLNLAHYQYPFLSYLLCDIEGNLNRRKDHFHSRFKIFHCVQSCCKPIQLKPFDNCYIISNVLFMNRIRFAIFKTTKYSNMSNTYKVSYYCCHPKYFACFTHSSSPITTIGRTVTYLCHSKLKIRIVYLSIFRRSLF